MAITAGSPPYDAPSTYRVRLQRPKKKEERKKREKRKREKDKKAYLDEEGERQRASYPEKKKGKPNAGQQREEQKVGGENLLDPGCQGFSPLELFYTGLPRLLCCPSSRVDSYFPLERIARMVVTMKVSI